MTSLIDKILIWYLSYDLQTTPSNLWKFLRFILHWLTLPIKLLIIGTLGFIMILRNLFWLKSKDVPKLPDYFSRQEIWQYVFANLTILNTDQIQLYVNRVDLNETPNGVNHNVDHQAYRQGSFLFLMRLLGVNVERMERALGLHFQGKFGVSRGYYPTTQLSSMSINHQSTSGDMLIGSILGLLHCHNKDLLDRYDDVIHGIVNNDYGMREGSFLPPSDERLLDLWTKNMQQTGGQCNLKSARASWAPGLLTVGAQSLNILAAIKTGLTYRKSKILQQAYNRLLWGYGYGLLSLFPTAFIPSWRGYFNDHNCINSAYILARLSTNRFGKIWWSLIVLYVWLLSYKWYNPYFTYLTKTLWPHLIRDSYVDKCKDYFYNEGKVPQLFFMEYVTAPTETTPKSYPISYDQMNNGAEFYIDEPQFIKEGGTGPLKRNGLGWLFAASLSDIEEAKIFLQNFLLTNQPKGKV